jgi:hypothetical protein
MAQVLLDDGELDLPLLTNGLGTNPAPTSGRNLRTVEGHKTKVRGRHEWSP